MTKIAAIVAKEVREALPPTIFFLFLFHMIALTRAVSLNDYSMSALRAAGATIGALIVAKAILVVEAMPISRLFSGRRMTQVFWKTALYSIVVLLFKAVEEAIPLVSKHGSLAAAAEAISREVSWPLVAVLALWIVGGLILYCLASELVRAVGPGVVKEVFFGTPGRSPNG